ncbi:MAG: acyl carrier protein [Bacteroidales bacterium]|nr:acyl carrier protein [Bacteroidales bacterium]
MIETVEIKNKIRSFIAETAFVSEDKINDNSLIFQEGIFDSMGFLSLINYIEDHFQIKADDAELLEENFESVEAIAEFIARKSN